MPTHHVPFQNTTWCCANHDSHHDYEDPMCRLLSDFEAVMIMRMQEMQSCVYSPEGRVGGLLVDEKSMLLWRRKSVEIHYTITVQYLPGYIQCFGSTLALLLIYPLPLIKRLSGSVVANVKTEILSMEV